MSKLALLVGSHFHPPAKALLAHLPTGATVQLHPDAENPYDAFGKAVAVFVSPRELPEEEHSGLEEDLRQFGWTIEDFLHSEPLQLGHLAQEGGRPLQAFQKRNPERALSSAKEAFPLAPCDGRLEWTNFGQDIIVEISEGV